MENAIILNKVEKEYCIDSNTLTISENNLCTNNQENVICIKGICSKINANGLPLCENDGSYLNTFQTISGSYNFCIHNNAIIGISTNSNSKTILTEMPGVYLFEVTSQIEEGTVISYNTKVIDQIIHNESTHVVAEFKEYLIKGDTSEFLMQYYKKKEIYNLLPKIFECYISCSVIFPNYVTLPESKYIYKNIKKKTKSNRCSTRTRRP